MEDTLLDLKSDEMKQLSVDLLQAKQVIDWEEIEAIFKNRVYHTDHLRLLLSLVIIRRLIHIESAEDFIDIWNENPYWQYFAGYEYVNNECPLRPTDIIVFENMVSEQDLEKLYSSFSAMIGEAFPRLKL